MDVHDELTNLRTQVTNLTTRMTELERAWKAAVDEAEGGKRKKKD